MPRRLPILSDLRSAQWNRDRDIAAPEAVGRTLCELPRKRGAATTPVKLGA